MKGLLTAPSACGTHPASPSGRCESPHLLSSSSSCPHPHHTMCSAASVVGKISGAVLLTPPTPCAVLVLFLIKLQNATVLPARGHKACDACAEKPGYTSSAASVARGYMTDVAQTWDFNANPVIHSHPLTHAFSNHDPMQAPPQTRLSSRSIQPACRVISQLLTRPLPCGYTSSKTAHAAMLVPIQPQPRQRILNIKHTGMAGGPSIDPGCCS